MIGRAWTHKYRQPGLLCTPRNFAQSSKFLGKKYFWIPRLSLRHFWAFPKIWRSHVFRDAHKRTFEVVDEALIFQGHLNVLWGSFMALLCSSRWSDQKCCKTDCVALKTGFQTRPMRAFRTHVLARYWFLKWGSKFHIFYKTLKIFNHFSRENHGHGDHEHGVRRGFSGVSFHLRRCPQGVVSVLCKKTPIFRSRRSKLDHLTVHHSLWPRKDIQGCGYSTIPPARQHAR